MRLLSTYLASADSSQEGAAGSSKADGFFSRARPSHDFANLGRRALAPAQCERAAQGVRGGERGNELAVLGWPHLGERCPETREPQCRVSSIM